MQGKSVNTSAFRPVRRGLQFVESTHKLIRFDEERRRILVLAREPCAAWIKTEENPYWKGWSPALNIATATGLSWRRLLAGRLPIEAVPWVDRDGEYDQILKARKQWSWMTWRRFIDLFPCEAVGAAARYARLDNQWDPLVVFTKIPESLELAVNNPALLCALNFNRLFRGLKGREDRMQWIHRNIHRKRRMIAAALGFPDSEGSIQVLTRLPAELCDPGTLLSLRAALFKPGSKILHHVSTLSPSGIRIMATENSILRCESSFYLDPKLVEADRIQFLAPWYAARDIQRIGAFLGYGEASIRITAYGSLKEQSRQLHWELDRYVARCPIVPDPDVLDGRIHLGYSVTFPEIPNIPLPQPPFPGTDTIIPIRDSRELFMEGKIMRHCIYTYLQELLSAQGDLGVYRVLHPERFTITVRHGVEGNVLCQARAYANGAVKRGSLEYVRNILGENQMSRHSAEPT